jgi:hypothetical protein
MRHLTRLLTALMVAGGLAGCAHNPNAEPRIRPRPTYVEVNNEAWLDMTIYVIDGAARMRLGTVGSTHSSTLRLPESMVGAGRMIRFQADPIGSSRTATSFEINVNPGETIHLTIPPNAGR